MSEYLDVGDYDRLIEMEPHVPEMYNKIVHGFLGHKSWYFTRSQYPTVRVREHGAGTGKLTHRLTDESFWFNRVEVEAVEIDGKSFGVLQERMQPFKRIRCVNADSVRCEHGAQRADAVLSALVDHHIPDSLKLDYLTGICESLSPYGIYISGSIFLREYQSMEDRVDALKEWHQYVIDYGNKNHHLFEKQEYFDAFVAMQEAAAGLGERTGKISTKEYENLLSLAGFFFSRERIGPWDLNRYGDCELENFSGIHVYRAWRADAKEKLERYPRE